MAAMCKSGAALMATWGDPYVTVDRELVGANIRNRRRRHRLRTGQRGGGQRSGQETSGVFHVVLHLGEVEQTPSPGTEYTPSVRCALHPDIELVKELENG